MAHKINKTILIEMNEINFEFIKYYTKKGFLKNIDDLISRHGLVHTVSEQKYEEVEPWVQWVSAHTGMAFAEHGVFRLGDAVGRDLHQIWEHLEGAGLQVGAVSPMNAENRTRQAAFFVPDPWTETSVTGSKLLRRLHAALRQAVNDNARSHLSVETIFSLLIGLARYSKFSSWSRYIQYASYARRKPWQKAMFLDLFLSDLFIGEVRRASPDFASLFLNAGAHIQHHYMYNAEPYEGDQSNPAWYIENFQDPLLDVYGLYDQIVGDIIRSFPDTRLIIATGLHQDPHLETTFYWRLKRHDYFLQQIGVDFLRVEPRMSRDFLAICETAEQAALAEFRLKSVRGDDGFPLFEVDNRGSDLFVTLSYPKDVTPGFGFWVGSERIGDLRDEIDFVAIKNGQHNGVGYLLDTERQADGEQAMMKLTDLPDVICRGFGLEWGQSKMT